MFRPVAEATLEIDAPPARVWEIMLDFSRYPEWNPFVVRVEQPEPIRVGASLRLHVRWREGGGASSGERITELCPPLGERPGRLAYDFTGLLHDLSLVRATRLQQVELLPGDRTRYSTREQFRGLLTAFLPMAKVRDGFLRHAQALKARAEAS